MDKQNLLVDIFRAEAKRGKPELTVFDIADHDLNQKPQPTGWLSKITHRVFPTHFLGIADIDHHLTKLVDLNVLTRLRKPSSNPQFGRYYYRLIGTRSPASKEQPDLAELARI